MQPPLPERIAHADPSKYCLFKAVHRGAGGFDFLKGWSFALAVPKHGKNSVTALADLRSRFGRQK